MLLVGLQFVIVAFAGHRYLLFNQVLPGLIDFAPDVISQAFRSAPVWGNEQINGFVCNRLMQNPAKFDDISNRMVTCSFINIHNDFEDTYWGTNQDNKGWSRTFSKTFNRQES